MTELFMENQRLDISSELSTILNFAIDDIKNFASRSTTWSKTIVLPGTSNNNKIFGHIFQIGHANSHNDLTGNVNYNFNAARAARVIIFQDQMQTFKGVLRLMQINVQKGKIEYEVAVFGELAGFNVALSSGKLEDLDFSAYDHSYSETSIIDSWANTSGVGVYYPLIDYGTYSTGKHDWDFRTFRPALHVYEFIDKIMDAVEFRWQSDLFETPRFKSLIVPHNQKTLQALSSRVLSASRNDVTDVINSGTPSIVPLEMSSVVTSIFTLSSGDSRFTFAGANPVTLTLNISFFGTYIANTISFTMALKKNGVVVPGTSQTVAADGTDTSKFYNWIVSDISLTFAPGDYFELVFNASTAYGTGLDRIRATNGTLFVDSAAALPADVGYGQSVQVNNCIPRNIRQIDFMMSIVRLFNLYVYEDPNDNRLIHFTPYIDFYSTNSADSVDWTYKLNRDKTINIRPMSELNAKKYEYKYKSDSDYYNELYRKRYSMGYGDYVFDSLFEFAEPSKGLEIIFSATPLVGYEGEDKVYSTIFKLSGTTEEKVDSNIRILQAKKITGVSSWQILDGVSVLDTITEYGYAGHFDDPDAPSNDLNFGVPYELFFTLVTGDLTKTQFNLYWSAYMAEVTDKDSKLMTGWFHLTPLDIVKLDFSNKVFIDGILYRLNSIKDYNASKQSDCKVELLKVNYLIY